MLQTIFLISLFVCISSQECRNGFFGSRCQYKCHCESQQCDNGGNCTGSSTNCETGWFGLKCQYQNLAMNASFSPANASNLVTNTPSNQCNIFESQFMTISWNKEIVFNWLRIKIWNPATLQNYSLKFLTANNTQWTGCINQRLSQIDFNTFDIHCDVAESIHTIKLEGDVVGSLCFIYINGGRNMALLQSNVTQTSQFLANNADFAVDGVTMESCYYGSCSHTNDTDTTPKWMLTFDKPYYINRFILYNRVDDRQDRLRNFTLQAMDDDHILLKHIDSSTTNETIYTVLFPKYNPIAKVTVSQTNKYSRDPVPYVTLNEFEAYGECVPGYWGLECRETCSDLCQHSCHLDDGTCRDVCFGYTNPPTCSQKCDPTKYGINCSKSCSGKCFNSLCDKQTGVCTQGCTGYSNTPLCTQPCGENYFGWNCTEKCSTGCHNQTCNSINGKCFACEVGLQGDRCDQACSATYFGVNCSSRCNDSCLNKICDPVIGSCLHCPDGKNGLQCGESVTSNDNTALIAGLVGGIGGAILILVILLVVFIVYRRRRNGRKQENGIHNSNHNNSTNSGGNIFFDSGSKSHTSKKNVLGSVYRKKKEVPDSPQKSDSKKKDSKPVEPYYNTVATLITNESIAVDELESFIKNRPTDYYKLQFQSLPQTKDSKSYIGLRDENKNKNRFKNICPYDHSRVHLDTNLEKNEGNYINASYIKGYGDGIEFIASQGPNTTTVYDFVRMLWEQKTEKVVMLTNLIEEGKTKCEKYWPDAEKMVFGEIKLKHIATQTFSDYTIRKLEISKKGHATQEITQFHYTTWPDKSVPTASWSLVDFEQKVFETPSKTPIVVHCSAGVGRTGTFIALHNVMTEAEQTGKVNFYDTVTKLRQDRMCMVQTAEQYEFLHKSALTAIVCMGTSVTANKFCDRLRTLEKKTFTGQMKMGSEFKAICNVSQMYYANLKNNEPTEPKETPDSVYQNADRTKDRFPEIATNTIYRPHLTTLDYAQGDYINALVLPSFFLRDQEIITQLPMPTTVTDFWRLITQLNVSLVVAFEVENMMKDKTFGNYMARVQDQVLSCPPFEVSCSNSKEEQLWKEHILNVCLGKGASSAESMEDHKIVHMECNFTDFDPNKMLAFIKAVRQHKSKGRVVYMCRNGAMYSGLAYVLCSLLDIIDNDSSITIPIVVGSIKSIRPAVIPTLEQYQLIYQVLEKYIQTSSEYSNVKSTSDGGKTTTSLNDQNDDETKVYVNF